MATLHRSTDMGAPGRLPRLARATGAIVAAGLLVGVGTALGRASASPSPMPSTGAGERPAPLATPDPPPLPTSASASGPTRIDHGVPVGFAHSRDGALMAAVSFTRVLGGDLVLHPDAYRAAMQVMAAPAYEDALRAKGETVLATLEARGHLVSNEALGLPVYVGVFPMTAAVTSYTDSTAEASVFGAVLVGDGAGPVSAGFGGGTYTLTWTALADGTSDWRITATQTTPGWNSASVAFPAASEPQPPFVHDLGSLSYAPPSS